jgi:hypothetical protein
MRASAPAPGSSPNPTKATDPSSKSTPKSVLTNIDREHLDHYGSFENVRSAFVRFINQTAIPWRCRRLPR